MSNDTSNLSLLRSTSRILREQLPHMTRPADKHEVHVANHLDRIERALENDPVTLVTEDIVAGTQAWWMRDTTDIRVIVLGASKVPGSVAIYDDKNQEIHHAEAHTVAPISELPLVNFAPLVPTTPIHLFTRDDYRVAPAGTRATSPDTGETLTHMGHGSWSNNTSGATFNFEDIAYEIRTVVEWGPVDAQD